MKKAIVLLADGFEDVEAITPIDYLRRAGIEVTTAAVTENLTVTSRWGTVKVIADTTIKEVIKQNDWDTVILPGGIPGAENLATSQEASALITQMTSAGKLICAICASPAIVLAPLGLLSGRKFTCFPGMEEKVKNSDWKNERVVIDGNIITSRAAGTAGEFAIAVIANMLDEFEAEKIARSVLMS